MSCRVLAVLALTFLSPSALHADPANAVERGRKALLERSFYPSLISSGVYRQLSSRESLRERYGLQDAPYANDGYPMGLRRATGLLGGQGATFDCLLCHGGSILGTSYVGLGNASLDLQAILEDMAATSGVPLGTPFPLANVRGTVEATAMLAWLGGFRELDLSPRTSWVDRGLHANLCEDVPAWWLLRKKQTMYHTGNIDARAVRPLMAFLLGPLSSVGTITRAEPTFADIQAYLLTLRPPAYPYPVDGRLAQQGQQLFEEHCASCHGTYSDRAEYPNRIVPLDVIGTDPTLSRAVTDESVANYNRSWFGQERGPRGDQPAARRTPGYQAPPLDGIWATAPFFHNGSVPTVYHVLHSSARPRTFTRSYRTDAAAYDPERLGWRFEEATPPGTDRPGFERRKVYDTRQPGRGNGGHTFGDRLTEQERLAVIEYLKTL